MDFDLECCASTTDLFDPTLSTNYSGSAFLSGD
jgi:hypothetical protein